MTPSIIDQGGNAGGSAYFFREVAPLNDAAQPFVEEYKYGTAGCCSPVARSDVFRINAMSGGVKAEALDEYHSVAPSGGKMISDNRTENWR
jgi:hypothetical protein